MAQHKVTINAPALTLGNADVELKVWKNAALVGTMKISRGNLVWVPRDIRKGYRISWVEFDQLMQEGGRKNKIKRE